MSEENTIPEASAPNGHICDVGLLDLRYAKSPDDIAHIRSISDVGLILIPENLSGALARISMDDVGTVVPVPQDSRVNCMTGQTRLSGESLAAGDPETILLVAGQTFITGEVTTVGYKEIRVYGQLFAPRSGQVAISAKLTQLMGQNFYLPGDARIIMGTQNIDQEFLDLLEGPTPLVVMGTLIFEDDVKKESLRAKITEIVLMGTITAPKALISVLEVITKEKMGSIEVKE